MQEASFMQMITKMQKFPSLRHRSPEVWELTYVYESKFYEFPESYENHACLKGFALLPEGRLWEVQEKY